MQGIREGRGKTERQEATLRNHHQVTSAVLLLSLQADPMTGTTRGALYCSCVIVTSESKAGEKMMPFQKVTSCRTLAKSGQLGTEVDKLKCYCVLGCRDKIQQMKNIMYRTRGMSLSDLHIV